MFFTLRSRRRRTEVNRVTSCYSTGSQTSHRGCPLANKVENTSMGIPKYDSQHSLQRSLEPIEVCLPPKKTASRSYQPFYAVSHSHALDRRGLQCYTEYGCRTFRGGLCFSVCVLSCSTTEARAWDSGESTCTCR